MPSRACEVTFAGSGGSSLPPGGPVRQPRPGGSSGVAQDDVREPAALDLRYRAERAGCEFRLASPRLSLVKIMRITGLDRRLLASQATCRLVRA